MDTSDKPTGDPSAIPEPIEGIGDWRSSQAEASPERFRVAEAWRLCHALVSDYPSAPIEYAIWHTSVDGIEAEVAAPDLDDAAKIAIIRAFADLFDTGVSRDERPGRGGYACDVRLSFLVFRHRVRIYMYTLLVGSAVAETGS